MKHEKIIASKDAPNFLSPKSNEIRTWVRPVLREIEVGSPEHQRLELLFRSLRGNTVPNGQN